MPRTLDLDDDKTTVALAAGGILALAVGWILDSRLLGLLGLAAAAAGGGLYARGKLAERSEKIETAESHIRSELDELDPVGQAQVLKDLMDPES